MTLPVNVVIEDPLAGFRWWGMSELWKGTEVPGVDLYVPNVNDCIMDDHDVTWRVTAVDPISKLSTLRIMDSSVAAQSLQGVTSISRLAPYQQMMRAFLNTAVTPYTMNLDSLWPVYGSDAAYIKVFQGIDTSSSGNVISQHYNNLGVLVSENIPLVLTDATNPNISRPLGFNCSTNLNNGEVVTVIVYSIDGDILQQQGFLIMNTNLIRGLGQNQNYITSIELVSNLLDPIDSNVINAPANIPISGANFQAQLNYVDGSNQLITVGTNKCKLFGLEEFNPAIAGVLNNLVLIYYLNSTEAAINISNPNSRSIPATYKIRAVNNTLRFSFKVFVVPNFNVSNHSFSNDYYLCSLDRSIFIKLLPNQYTITMANGGLMDTNPQSPNQEFTIAVNMAAVIPVGYTGFIFPEAITLKYGVLGNVGWIIDYTNSSVDTYGTGAYAAYSLLGGQVFTVAASQTSLTDWLQLLWEPIKAIFDPSVALSPPVPTHMQFMYDGVLSPILHIAENWNINHPKIGSTSWGENATLSIIWLVLESDGVTLGTLGISPLVLQNTL